MTLKAGSDGAAGSRGSFASRDARLDAVLVSSGLARSRGHARELIDVGAVTVDGTVVARASKQVHSGSRLDVAMQAGDHWVGRGAGKLQGALAAFGSADIRAGPGLPACAPRAALSARGRRCLDVGASTGGFTQVLLAEGAAHVVALDVGHGQLVPSLAADPRVTERSGLSIRDVRPGDLGPAFDLIVGDLSFISLRLVLPHLVPLLAPDGDAVLLVKPQFEVGRGGRTKHGVVRDPADRAAALLAVLGAATAAGWVVHGVVPSSVTGITGNQEYLGWFSARSGGGMTPAQIEDRVEELTQATQERKRR